MESFAHVWIFQISLYITISTSKSEHVSHLCPDFFNCNFPAMSALWLISLIILYVRFSFQQQEKKLGQNQSPYVAQALHINIEISGKDRVSFPFFRWSLIVRVVALIPGIL